MPLRPLPYRVFALQSNIVRQNVSISTMRRMSSQKAQSQKPSQENKGARIGTLIGSAALGLVIAGFAAWKITSVWKPVHLDALPSHDLPTEISTTRTIKRPETTHGASIPPLPSRTHLAELSSPPADPSSTYPPPDSIEAHLAATADPSHLHTNREGEGDADAEGDEPQGAYDPRTGEINWDCPCLGGMAHGPCGMQFREAFSCFVFSEVEPKGMDCIEKFRAMQDCFREHPEVYGEEIMDDEEPQHGQEHGHALEDPPAALDTAKQPPEPALPSSPTSSESGSGSLPQERKLQKP
ncbi:hypothetical protein M422DRAFT_32496 [Sphaerobolus stellatus SS14]|uniref:Mitochondrial intermembrane space import and assembly protein 40 n=1 Tax=Sphaerobolus stellatus (strain SS14) TaxID=990650 RepID=A0A0C9VPW1_SPHS4|nr:hypothetical protein M422DRAFT_32496 [Sphaerobolus stellatus SS14]